MRTPTSPASKLVLIPFRCGRSDCPLCARIKRGRLIRRLQAAPWPNKLYMWTITTDPSVLSSDEALQSISRRWHRVCRTLYRHYPTLKYFRVLEFTQSGLPHLHVLFNQYVEWHKFRQLLVRHCFGRVLHFKCLPREGAFSYLTKYLTKGIEVMPYMRYIHMRSWSSSTHYLPAIKYFAQGTEFDLVWIGPLDWHVEAMMHLLESETLRPRSP